MESCPVHLKETSLVEHPPTSTGNGKKFIRSAIVKIYQEAKETTYPESG